jgi:hypothetical protein
MKILTPGHKYVLQNVESPLVGQTIQFHEQKLEVGSIKSRSGQPLAQPKVVTVNDGCSTEEALVACGHRLEFMNANSPNPYVFLAAHHVSLALSMLNEAANAQRQAAEQK